MSVPAFFRRLDAGGESVFEPLPETESGWGGTLQGPAITGLLARAAERAVIAEGRTDLQAVRASFEMFRPSKMAPTAARATIVRSGRRIVLVDAELVQGGTRVARSHTFFAVQAEQPEGRSWHRSEQFPVPGDDVAGDRHHRLYRSEGGDWSADPSQMRAPARTHEWQRSFPVVEGDEPTPFTMLGSAADLVSLVVHWSDQGIQFINMEATVSFSRLPVGAGVGLAVSDRSAHAGISAGSAVIYDEAGSFGAGLVTALAQPGRGARVGGRDLS